VETGISFYADFLQTTCTLEYPNHRQMLSFWYKVHKRCNQRPTCPSFYYSLLLRQVARDPDIPRSPAVMLCAIGFLTFPLIPCQNRQFSSVDEYKNIGLLVRNFREKWRTVFGFKISMNLFVKVDEFKAPKNIVENFHNFR
jgi:hypothetical protein